MIRVIFAFLLCQVVPASADVWGFETPSGNIQCTVGEGFDGADITCTIHNRNGPPALPRPAACMQDWGHTFFMANTGPVEMICEQVRKSGSWGEVAQYGVTGRFGGFVCHSSRQGLDCRNEQGRGFFCHGHSRSYSRNRPWPR